MGKKSFCNCLVLLRVPRPASSPPAGGLPFAGHRAALHPRSALPPPRRVGLRFPAPVGHGRGLASRPGCAVPGEGIDSARRSSMPGERPGSNVSAHSPASTGPASSRADPDHASVVHKSNKLQKKQPPHPKRRAAVAAVVVPPTITPNSPPLH